MNTVFFLDCNGWPRTLGPRLFKHADLLSELVAPYPELRVVLSTSWVPAYSPDGAKETLPPSLRSRVIGSLNAICDDFPEWTELSRREQIQRYADRNGIHSWLALEGDCRGWPEELHENVVCLGEGGLDSSSARKELVEKLARMHTKEFQRICRQHSWTVDMLAAYEQIEGAAQKLTEAASAPEHAARLQAGKDAVLSCGTAIAAGYSIDVAHKRESLALTFLAYALGWDDAKRAAIEQLLKSPAVAAPANPAEMIDLAEATLQETQNWFRTTAREAYEN